MEFTEIYEQVPRLTVKLVHTEKGARKAMRALGVGDAFEPSDARTTYRIGDTRFIVYLSADSVDKSAAQDIGLLAHEATHVAQGYFQAIGEEDPGDEFYAYTVQAVTQELCDQHFRWKKRRLKRRR